MRHVSLPALLLAAAALLAACGADDAAPAATQPATTQPATTQPAGSTTPPTSAGMEYATGADDVVVSVSYEGGFAPPGAIFSTTPVALITGDGRAVSTGPTILSFPGPLLPNVLQQTIAPEGIQQVLALADELALLADIEYIRDDQIADAPSTVVTISVDGAQYVHAAYALDVEPETDPARVNLSQFVVAMTDLAGTVEADLLGPDEPFEASTYLIQASEVDLATMSFDIEPTVVPWPADAPVRLVESADCGELPAEVAEALFADATQLTFFSEDDVTYQVAAVPQYPGRTC